MSLVVRQLYQRLPNCMHPSLQSVNPSSPLQLPMGRNHCNFPWWSTWSNAWIDHTGSHQGRAGHHDLLECLDLKTNNVLEQELGRGKWIMQCYEFILSYEYLSCQPAVLWLFIVCGVYAWYILNLYILYIFQLPACSLQCWVFYYVIWVT